MPSPITDSAVAALLQNHGRQVHLDFHTSPFIPDVARDFNADQFAQTFVDAHVNSVTVFAKCHHGQCYYPTKTGVQHPALNGRDLLGEQIDALHKRGIRAPIYTTVGWEEDVANRFPQWRQMTANGYFVGRNADGHGQPGRWKTLDFTDPDYLDYLEAHVREFLERYGDAVDGVFLDIVMFEWMAMYSDAALRFREKHGIIGDDAFAFARFAALAYSSFAERFTGVIHSLRLSATIFYNSDTTTYVDASLGIRARAAFQTHYEVESLPSGFWGYLHFPRQARHFKTWNKPWLAMTGRFQKMWGDFGGIKPVPALEFETFRAQALGGANSVGDQLPPRGVLDPAAYRLIGDVYRQIEEAEPFYANSIDLPPAVGILLASYPTLDRNAATKSEEGAVLLCEETHYDCVFHDDGSDLDAAETPLLFLPDSTVITKPLGEKLTAYYAAGGKLLLSYRAGFDAEGNFALPFLPLSFHGETTKYPTYWRAQTNFWADAADSDRVMYSKGMNVVAPGTETLVQRVLPYFKRTDAHYMSHFQTPPIDTPDTFPAVIAGERFVYFADPIFREYRQTGNLAAKEGWKRAVARLIGEPVFGAGLPTTTLIVPRRQDNDLLLTLLHYIPVRKSLDIDIIEERMGFAGEILRLPAAVTDVRHFPSGEPLAPVTGEPGAFVLPPVKGRLLVRVPGYFGSIT